MATVQLCVYVCVCISVCVCVCECGFLLLLQSISQEVIQSLQTLKNRFASLEVIASLKRVIKVQYCHSEVKASLY